jgi:hypothetical protein
MPQEDTHARLALEDLHSVAVSITVTFFFVQFDSDPVSSVLAFNFSNEFDGSDLSLSSEGDE